MKRRHRERLPHPRDVGRDLEDIVRAIFGAKPLIEEYDAAYHAAYQSSVGERSKTGAQVADDGSVPGATASIAANKEKMRGKLEDAAKKIGTALSDLRSARDDIDRAFRTLGRDEGYEPTTLFERTASRSDLAETAENQQRRRAMGVTFGEG